MDIFHLFGKGSGFKLNVSKTVAMGLGKWKNKADCPFGIEGKNKIKIYELTFTNRQPNILFVCLVGWFLNVLVDY